jgi:S1-C subfamily serine protease
MVVPAGLGITDIKAPSGLPAQRLAEGRHSYLKVRFAGMSTSLPAALGRVSDDYSVAIIKIASDKGLAIAEISPDDEPPEAGDRATVMGFPRTVAAVNTDPQSAAILTDPTIHIGRVGRVMGAGSAGSDELDRFCPGCYQLDVGSVDLSNSGGPVINDSGEVIGLYQNLVTRNLSASLGVPIRVGRELMGVRASN